MFAEDNEGVGSLFSSTQHVFPLSSGAFCTIKAEDRHNVGVVQPRRRPRVALEALP